jgi:UDP-N-acetylglucosamine 2-epimerase (non-hydrolysing)
MPEEINRIITDQLSDLLFTPSADGDDNLRREGVAGKICRVGNVMIDTLVRLLPSAGSFSADVLGKPYVLVTLHRPSNVDDLPWLSQMLGALAELSRDLAVVFPVHPRTRARIEELRMPSANGRLRLVEPKPYLQFLAMQRDATAVITDSGGIQEETTFLGIPCLTVRETTERPVTVTLGTNVLVGRDISRLQHELQRILRGEQKPAAEVPLWDGHAAERIAQVILG